MKKVLKLPVTEVCITNGNEEQLSTTLAKIWVDLAEQSFEVDINELSVIEATTGTKEMAFGQVTTASRKLAFAGQQFDCDLLLLLLKFKKEGVDPFHALWFWYDSDSVRDDLHDSYRFFVVAGDKIVREAVSFSDHNNSGFDPDIFEAEDDRHSDVWRDDAEWREANTKYWYRKFYTETRMGQLMVLRAE